MYFQILKKDIKRKKTMNIILLVFVILASMFISSSVNNMVTVTQALDTYFERSELGNYFAGVISNGYEYADFSPVEEEIKNYNEIRVENAIGIPKKEYVKFDGKTVDLPLSVLLTPFEGRIYTYYNEDNSELTKVKPGEMYLCSTCEKAWNVKKGQTVTIDIQGVKKDFKLAGFYKDAMFNPEVVGNKRLVISQKDFDYFYEKEEIIPFTGQLADIFTDDEEDMQNQFNELNQKYAINYNLPQSMLKNAYFMDVLTNAVLLVLSFFIVLIALTILKFSINFTMEEEFREIGVMKAIGLPESKTRWMYVTKYTAIGIVGSIVGLGLGVPFGNMLLQASADKIVIMNQGQYMLNGIAAIFVALLIVFFSYRCTSKMKKFTPMDAIRNGQTGERYGKKGRLSLSKSKLSNPLFLAMNDICSSTRRYATILLSFTLSMILVVVLSNTANTLKSSKMVALLGIQESDLILSTEALDTGKILDKNGYQYVEDYLENMQEELNEEGIPCDVFGEIVTRIPMKKGNVTISPNGSCGLRTNPDGYSYIEGSSPQNESEVALTAYNAKRLGVEVGDTVESKNGKDLIVCGLFDSFNNMGDSARVHKSFLTSEDTINYCMGMQVQYKGNPNEDQKAKYKKQILGLYPDSEPLTMKEYNAKTVGDAGNIVQGLKYMALLVVLIINVLMVILMERSFISKEKSEIALLKAIGFKNSTLVTWHSLRILLLVVVAAIISLLISTPITSVLIKPIFAQMGALQIQFEIHYIENFIIYPVIMIVFTVVATWLTAQFMHGIHASDIREE